MQLIKYEGNLFYKIIYKIKSFFKVKNECVEKSNIPNIYVQSQNELDKNVISGCKSYIATDNIIKLVNEFETNQGIIKKLTDEQIKTLIEYYQEKNKELDRIFEYKKNKFNNLAKKLNDFCDNAQIQKGGN